MKSMVYTDKRGYFLVLAAGLMLTACILAGFTIDLGRAYLVKGELQNAADATALAGASALHQEANGGWNWSEAVAEANGFIGKNRTDGEALTTCQVERGFWNMSTATAEPLGSGSTSTGTCYGSVMSCRRDADCGVVNGCQQLKFPYVKVSVGKSAGQDGVPAQNGGPVPALFARVIGWNGFEPRAGAMAISGSPGSLPSGEIFPFVITQCLKYDVVDLKLIGSDKVIKLNWDYLTTSGNMLAGQWSSLSLDDKKGTKEIKEYIDYLAGSGGDKSPKIKVTDEVLIGPLSNSSPYENVRKLIEAGKGKVLMPVVDCNLPATGTAPAKVTVKGFIAVQLTEPAVSAGELTGSFLNDYQAPPGALPGGETTNAVIHPKLVH